MLGVTGQQKRNSVQTKVVGSLPTFTKLEDLRDSKSMINQRDLSGKEEGAAVTVKDEAGNFMIYIATGSKPEDEWVPLYAAVEQDDVASEQVYPVEFVDMIDVVVADDSSEIVTAIPGATTNLVQTPIKDLPGEVVWRNHLVFTGGFRWVGDGTVAARKRFNLRINGILGQEGQYYDILSLMASTYTIGEGEELPEVMPVIRDAKTNSIGVWVDTNKSQAATFGLNLVIEWDSPGRL